MSSLKDISGKQLTYIATTIANILFDDVDLASANVLSNIFATIGDVMGILASQEEARRVAATTSASTKSSANNQNE